MKVSVSVGSGYDKALMIMDMEEAMQLMVLVQGKGIIYFENDTYKRREVEINISNKQYEMHVEPIVVELPAPDLGADINQF